MKVKGDLGGSDHEKVEVKILWKARWKSSSIKDNSSQKSAFVKKKKTQRSVGQEPVEGKYKGKRNLGELVIP